MGNNGNDDDDGSGGSIPSMLGRPAAYQGYHVSCGTIRLPEERHVRGYKTPIHQVYRPRGKKRTILERFSCPFRPLVRNTMK